jgi:hypothetical protein
MNDETRPLIDLLKKIIDARRSNPLNPAWLANEALLELDPRGETPVLMRAACLMQLRELAEGLLGSAKPPRTAPHADAAQLRRESEADFAHARRLKAWRTGRNAPDEGDGPSSA